MGYTYSVVIPHYNSSKLLERMLLSIPERDDIQVIVVDDKSSDEEVASLQKLKHNNLEIYYQAENKGAGAVRNVGLKHVKGKWVSVVDADDFFAKNAFKRFDEEIHEEFDYILFCISYYDANSNSLVPALGNVSNNSNLLFINNLNIKNFRYLKLKSTVCYNKLVNVAFLKKYNICFEECQVNNDVLYAYMVSLKSEKMKVLKDVLYIKENVSTSITQKKRNIAREFLFYLQAQKRNGLFELLNFKKYPFYRSDVLYVLYFLRERGFFETLAFFQYRKKNIDLVKEARIYYKQFFRGLTIASVDNKFSSCVIG